MAENKNGENKNKTGQMELSILDGLRMLTGFCGRESNLEKDGEWNRVDGILNGSTSQCNMNDMKYHLTTEVPFSFLRHIYYW